MISATDERGGDRILGGEGADAMRGSKGGEPVVGERRRLTASRPVL